MGYKIYTRPEFLSEKLYGFCGWHGESWRLDSGTKKGCQKCASVDSTFPIVKGPAVTKRPRNVCILGHGHDSVGEAGCCPLVYEAARAAGLKVYRPGKPGIPCFSLDPDASTGRPVYVSVDWLLLSFNRKPVLAIDYKGKVAKSKRFDKGWARGRRILETELGIRVIELKDCTEVAAALAARNKEG